MSTIKTAIDQAGGPSAAAKVCGVSPRAVYKWLANASLPRTDYTGETDYAQALADAAAARGDAFDVTWLRENAKPRPAAGLAASTPAKKAVA